MSDDSTSDRFIKSDVCEITRCLDRVGMLTGYSYCREDVQYTPRRLGLLAEEVEKVAPEAVTLVNGVKKIAYGAMVPILINAVNDLQDQRDEDRECIVRLQNQIDDLYRRLNAVVRG